MAFNGARHFGIRTANISTVNHNTTVHLPPATDSPAGSNQLPALLILHGARAVEATHISSTAAYAPKCTPGTRTKVISEIVDWIEGGLTPILWFTGPAGAGKTCVMREMTSLCQSSHLPTCAYFFSTRVPGLENERPFIATIVHQLLVDIPALKPAILQTISEYPSIFEESLEYQMEKLIVEPLANDQRRTQPHCAQKVIIAIDGFDECRSPTERYHLLQLLYTLLTKLPRSFLIILASRPELDIRTTFDTAQFRRITKTLRLEDHDGRDDVRYYCCDEFAKIRATHPMRKRIPENWPIEVVLNTLVYKSSGHFLLPSVIFRYISNPRRNPVEMLEKAMSVFPTHTPLDADADSDHPWMELDALYTFILHPPSADAKSTILTKRILHFLLSIESVGLLESYHRSPSFFDHFLQLPRGTVEDTLCDLHSILSVPEDGFKPITFHHKSSEDYLLGKGRSGDMYQAEGDTHMDLVRVCGGHLERWALAAGAAGSSPVLQMHSTATKSEPGVRYAALRWVHHLNAWFNCRGKDGEEVGEVPAEVLEFDPRVMWRCQFVFWGEIFGAGVVHELGPKVHSAVCQPKELEPSASESSPPTSCVRLCKALQRMKKCSADVYAFTKPMKRLGREERFSALGRFDFETGLYDRLDLD